MKTQILGTIAGLLLAAAGLQAQPDGIGVGVGVGRGRGAAAGAMMEQFQQAATMTMPSGGRGFVMASGNSGRTVVGRPVSGTEEQRSQQTLGDGTVIASSETDQFYRDSAGRTRVELKGRTVIVDPVAHVTVTLNEATKTARVIKLPTLGESGGEFAVRRPAAVLSTAPPVKTTSSTSTYTITIGDGATATVTSDDGSVLPKAAVAVRGNDQNRQHEELGVESMNGALATHTRDTLLIPQGQIGNNRDIHVVNERWYSDDLQMLVKTVNSDPRFGDNTYELSNISRDEPDASLFQIPADYKVMDIGPDFKVGPATPVNK